METQTDQPGAAPPHSPGPRWARIATANVKLRIAVVAGLVVAYVGIYHLVPGGLDRFALRPLNLLIIVVCGFLLGMRGGLAIGTVLAALNVALYLRDGVFFDTAARMTSNLLSIVAGIFAGAFVGMGRDLALTLRGEVDRRHAAERRKEELTELLVHDLKNPLAAILGHSALLQQEEMSAADVKDSADSIHNAAEMLKRMVLNLLDIGRAEDGELRPRLIEVDLDELVEEVRASVERQLADRRQRLVVSAAPTGNGHSKIVADPELVRRMLVNLVDNAIKYTPRECTIQVAVAERLDTVELAVRDEGPGIPAGFEEKIFDKYVRLERDAGTAAHASRGLGLAFCRLAAEAHGGRIWVEKADPRGSVFRVQLPRSGPRLPPPVARR